MAASKLIISSEISRSILNEYISNRNFFQELSNGRDLEFLKVLDMLDRVRQKWAEEVKQNEILREQMTTLENDLHTLRQEKACSNERLRHARTQLAALVSERDELKLENNEMERKLQLVKDLIKPDISHMNDEEQRKLAFLNDASSTKKVATVPARYAPARKTNGSQDDGVDYDKTEDTLDQLSFEEESCLRSGKVYRRSQSGPLYGNTSKRSKSGNQHLEIVDEENEVPSKRSKGSAYTNTSTLITTATTTTITADQDNNVPPPRISIRHSFNRSMSESNLLLERQQRVIETAKFNALTNQYGTASTLDLRSPLVSSRSWLKGTTIENRGHRYVDHTPLMGDKCDVCGRYIGWGGKPASKCKDCNLHVHKSCISMAPMPCIPHTPTPRTPGKQRPRLKDFCPNTQPMIPYLIIHCVIGLDRYYLNSEGLYRIPGQESQILKLLNDFKNPRFQPKLEIQDPETITGCIKRFLRQLRDSLIPSSSWIDFVTAAEQNDAVALDRCVVDLPIPNRDTLAYLCCHFQKVCENSGRNKMTPEVLARSIAPTIVGRAPVRTMNFAQSSDEAMKQTKVMLALLHMPCGYWAKFCFCEMASRGFDNSNGRTLAPSLKQQMADDRTPRRHMKIADHGDSRISPSAADRSILGPIRTPPSDSNGNSVQSAVRRGNFFLNPY